MLNTTIFALDRIKIVILQLNCYLLVATCWLLLTGLTIQFQGNKQALQVNSWHNQTLQHYFINTKLRPLMF